MAVYLIHGDFTMKDDVYKFGHTHLNQKGIRGSYTRAYGDPSIIYFRECKYPEKVEEYARKRMRHVGICCHYELFKGNWKEMITIIDDMIDNFKVKSEEMINLCYCGGSKRREDGTFLYVHRICHLREKNPGVYAIKLDNAKEKDECYGANKKKKDDEFNRWYIIMMIRLELLKR